MQQLFSSPAVMAVAGAPQTIRPTAVCRICRQRPAAGRVTAHARKADQVGPCTDRMRASKAWPGQAHLGSVVQDALGARLPAAVLAGLIGSASLSLAAPDAVRAQEQAPPPQRPQATQTKEGPQSMEFRGNKSQNAPAVRDSNFQLPEGNQWRYSEFINAVQNGKVERVRFSKEGGQLQVICAQPLLLIQTPVGTSAGTGLTCLVLKLVPPVQLTAVDGRRAMVILPNDPDLVDILASNNVDISVSEGEQQGNLVSLLGNLIFPLLAFGGLFYLFQRAGNNGQVQP